MREPILKAVAMPPRIFLAPFVPAMLNMLIQGAIMFMFIGIFSLNPLFFLTSIFIVHVFLIIVGTREPHMSHMLQAWGVSGPNTSHNIYKSRGVKIAP